MTGKVMNWRMVVSSASAASAAPSSTNCHDAFFNVQTYAGWLSSFAGVLGAVVVAAIALRLGNPPELERHARRAWRAGPEQMTVLAEASLHQLARPLLAMPVALVAALLAAYGYGVVSATTDCGAASELAFFVGGEFGIGLSLTLFAVLWLLRDYETHGHAVQNGRLVLRAATAIIAFYLAIAIEDYHSAVGEGTDVGEILATALPLVFTVGPALVLSGWESMRNRLLARWPDRVRILQRTMALAIVVVILASGAQAVLNLGTPPVIPVWLWALFSASIGVLLGGLLLQMPMPSDSIDVGQYQSLVATSVTPDRAGFD
jgi:hypothetical protein